MVFFMAPLLVGLFWIHKIKARTDYKGLLQICGIASDFQVVYFDYTFTDIFPGVLDIGSESGGNELLYSHP